MTDPTTSTPTATPAPLVTSNSQSQAHQNIFESVITDMVTDLINNARMTEQQARTLTADYVVLMRQLVLGPNGLQDFDKQVLRARLNTLLTARAIDISAIGRLELGRIVDAMTRGLILALTA